MRIIAARQEPTHPAGHLVVEVDVTAAEAVAEREAEPIHRDGDDTQTVLWRDCGDIVFAYLVTGDTEGPNLVFGVDTEGRPVRERGAERGQATTYDRLLPFPIVPVTVLMRDGARWEAWAKASAVRPLLAA